VVTVFSSLTSKLVVTDSFGLTSKPAVGFLVEPQNQSDLKTGGDATAGGARGTIVEVVSEVS
jgi:hypothetical protein